LAVVERSFVELSLNFPVATNCCVEPTATDGVAGATSIDTSVATGVFALSLEVQPTADATRDSTTNARANIPVLLAFLVMFIERLFL
jgi:hypothetical protein